MGNVIDELTRDQLVTLTRVLCAEVDALVDERDILAARERARADRAERQWGDSEGRERRLLGRVSAASYAAEHSPPTTVREDVLRALRG